MKLLAIACALFAAAAAAQDGSGIGYPTVDAALQALKARSDVTVSVRDGWTIVDDRSASTIWSFTPPGHPAHPAAVKRTVVPRDGAMFVQMNALCQADKAACDRLIEEFKQLNERMAQDIRARKQGRAPEIAVAASNRDASWRPSPQQIALAERLTLAYFAAKDAGKYDEAYAYLSPVQKQNVSFERWTSMAGEINAKLGAVQGRSIRKITWYKDPPNVVPGVYAAVDYSSEFANTALHCGFVAWHEQADGSFLLQREEQNFIDRADLQKMKPGEMEKVRAQFRC